jgi:hypothetical protein
VQHEYGEDGVETDRLSGRDVVETARDWKLWFALVFNICASVPTQAFSVFLPLVLAALGFSNLEANLVCNRAEIKAAANANMPIDDCSAVCLWSCWVMDIRLELGQSVGTKLLFFRRYGCADFDYLRQERGYHIVASIGIGLIGLIVTVTAESQGGKYAGLCVLLFGCYVSAPLTMAWLSGNTPGKRSPTLTIAAYRQMLTFHFR